MLDIAEEVGCAKVMNASRDRKRTKTCKPWFDVECKRARSTYMKEKNRMKISNSVDTELERLKN